MAKLIKQKSDFTLLKTKHQLATNGTIYESDYMTISPIDDVFNDQIPLFSDGNFKFSVNTSDSIKHKHPSNYWVRVNEAEEGSGIVWTESNITTSRTTEYKIEPKVNYTSLQDFAYYGSATQLINASINNIAAVFPAGIYFESSFPEKMYISEESENYSYFGNEEGYVIDNGFNIDILTNIQNAEDVPNPLRYLLYSHNDYEWDGGENITVETVVNFTLRCKKENYSNKGVFLGKTIISCQKNTGEIEKAEIFVYYINGSNVYLTKDYISRIKYIRPKKEIINREYSRLDEFEKILLDRTTNPIYTANFMTPFETETGNKEMMVSYTWPSNGDYNPIIKGPSFEIYIGKLISLAEFYDDYYSDNIVRSMTHESVKNLDWTFVKHINNLSGDFDMDASKIEIMERLWGRIYDDIKREISVIKNMNNVTYDEKSNAPDYFLTDFVENSGFEPKTLDLMMDNDETTDNLEYSSRIDGYTAFMANNEFFRRLRINSRYLNSVKGTREGIDAMMALLGLNSDDYEINEKICVVNNFPDFETVSKLNMKRSRYLDNLAEGSVENGLNGLPLARVEYWDTETGSTPVSYVIPWYDIREHYDNDVYFQMYGGWGKMPSRKIAVENEEGGYDYETIYSDSDFTIYDETKQRLRVAFSEDEMYSLKTSSLNEGDICCIIGNTERTYFKYEKGEDGYLIWVKIEDIDSNTEIKYLESIVETTLGNNPHIGYGKYDDGQEYINRTNSIFGYLCDDFDNPADWESASTVTFEIGDKETDNQKCWFFTNDNDLEVMYEGQRNLVSNEEKNSDANAVFINNFNGDKTITKSESTGQTIHPHNGEGGEVFTEPASFSLINLKNMEIIFKIKGRFGDVDESKKETFINNYKDYLRYVVMHYVKQMIPSTTIFSYEFDDWDTGEITISFSKTQPSTPAPGPTPETTTTGEPIDSSTTTTGEPIETTTTTTTWSPLMTPFSISEPE